jgi:hypothetical protein
MDSRPKYEIIGKYIYTFSRIDYRLSSLAQRLEADDDRGSELMRKFSQVAADMAKLRDERDAVLANGDLPTELTAAAYVERCDAALAQLKEVEALAAQ